jgi:hypothetical protein
MEVLKTKTNLVMNKQLTLKETIACLLIIFSCLLPFSGDKLPKNFKVLDFVKIIIVEGVKLLDEDQ